MEIAGALDGGARAGPGPPRVKPAILILTTMAARPGGLRPTKPTPRATASPGAGLPGDVRYAAPEQLGRPAVAARPTSTPCPRPRRVADRDRALQWGHPLDDHVPTSPSRCPGLVRSASDAFPPAIDAVIDKAMAKEPAGPLPDRPRVRRGGTAGAPLQRAAPARRADAATSTLASGPRPRWCHQPHRDPGSCRLPPRPRLPSARRPAPIVRAGARGGPLVLGGVAVLVAVVVGAVLLLGGGDDGGTPQPTTTTVDRGGHRPRRGRGGGRRGLRRPAGRPDQLRSRRCGGQRHGRGRRHHVLTHGGSRGRRRPGLRGRQRPRSGFEEAQSAAGEDLATDGDCVSDRYAVPHLALAEEPDGVAGEVACWLDDDGEAGLVWTTPTRRRSPSPPARTTATPPSTAGGPTRRPFCAGGHRRLPEHPGGPPPTRVPTDLRDSCIRAELRALETASVQCTPESGAASVFYNQYPTAEVPPANTSGF